MAEPPLSIYRPYSGGQRIADRSTCEASGKRLVRWSGNDEAALALARDNALAIGAGHTFLIFLGDGFFPVNVLAAVRVLADKLAYLRRYSRSATTTSRLPAPIRSETRAMPT